MFQDAFLDDRAESQRPWTVAVSLLAQCLAICVAVLIPLLTAVDLPARQWMSHLLAPPPTPPAAAPAPPRAAPAAAPAQRFNEMTTPAVIPEDVAVVVDEPDVSGLSDLGVPGVVSIPGAASGGVPDGLLSQLITTKDVPKPPVVSKPVEAAPMKPVPVGGAVQAAMILHRVDPVYPALARQARVSGLVKIEAIIGEDGAIRELRVMSGPPMLVRAAIDAVKQWRYRPTLLNKVPVAVITQIDVNFRLGG